ncbi:hypothetical protein BASA60_009340 [Batrachochytrium salamandrivorans]|nr:hypothetical protein BASA60_009340 [Batrachochytrium salamandrivorans]
MLLVNNGKPLCQIPRLPHTLVFTFKQLNSFFPPSHLKLMTSQNPGVHRGPMGPPFGDDLDWSPRVIGAIDMNTELMVEKLLNQREREKEEQQRSEPKVFSLIPPSTC